MRFSITASLLAFSSMALAQTAGFDPITAPTQDQEVPAGSSLDIVWTSTQSGTVTITLLEGATAATLQLGETIASSIDNTLGTYTWTVPSTAEYATYGFKISLDSDPTTFQYSFPFHIAASSASGSSSIVAAASSTVVVSSVAGSATIVAASTAVPTSIVAASSAVPTYVAGTTLSSYYPSASSSATGAWSSSNKTNTSVATPTASGITQSTGAAGHLEVTLGLGLSAGVMMALGLVM